MMQSPPLRPTDPPRALPGTPPGVRGAVEGKMKVWVYMKVSIYKWPWLNGNGETPARSKIIGLWRVYIYKWQW